MGYLVGFLAGPWFPRVMILLVILMSGLMIYGAATEKQPSDDTMIRQWAAATGVTVLGYQCHDIFCDVGTTVGVVRLKCLRECRVWQSSGLL